MGGHLFIWSSLGVLLLSSTVMACCDGKGLCLLEALKELKECKKSALASLGLCEKKLLLDKELALPPPPPTILLQPAAPPAVPMNAFLVTPPVPCSLEAKPLPPPPRCAAPPPPCSCKYY